MSRSSVSSQSSCLAMWLVAAVIGFALVGGKASGNETGQGNTLRPNIILIVADDLGFQDLGCCGGQVCQTPHIDRLAREGVRGTNFYVTWPACTPSRGSILTGRYPQRNGLYDMIRNDMVNYGHRFTPEEYAVSPEMTLGLDVREVTIGQVLRELGYATGVIGKWDSGQAKRFLPRQRGFDFFFGFANTGIDYWTHERYGVPSLFQNNERISRTGYATELFRDEAVKFIDRHHRQPFFLYLPFNAPHGASNLEKDSYQAPDSNLARTSANPQQPTNGEEYAAMVESLDEAVGQVLDRLDHLQIADRTLVLFLSDNGGTKIGSNGPLRGFKSSMFEGGIRVPLLARWPGKIPAGRICEQFLTSLELFPTLTAAAGGELPTGVKLDGFDCLPVLVGASPSAREAMFWERRTDRAARVGNWKWVRAGQREYLFNLTADLGEMRDLSRDEPERLEALRSAWNGWRREMDESEPRGPFRDY